MFFKKVKETILKGDKKTMIYLIMLATVGIALLLLSTILNKPLTNTPNPLFPKDNEQGATEQTNQTNQQLDYEAKLENRLKAALSKIAGVGKTEVMITISYGREIVVGQDITTESSTTKEQTGDGASQTETKSEQTKTLYVTGSDGRSSPLVLKEIEPKIEGIIIVAEGGGNILVKEELTRAAEALLGIPAHKIQVYKMEQGG